MQIIVELNDDRFLNILSNVLDIELYDNWDGETLKKANVPEKKVLIEQLMNNKEFLKAVEDEVYIQVDPYNTFDYAVSQCLSGYDYTFITEYTEKCAEIAEKEDINDYTKRIVNDHLDKVLEELKALGYTVFK